MIINKRELQAALAIVKPGLGSSEMIEQSTSFAFLGDRVVTYNDTISLSHPVSKMHLEGAIQAEELYNLLDKVDRNKIKIAQSDSELKIKSGATKAGIRLQSEIKLPLKEIDETKDWEDLPEEFCIDLDFIKDSAGRDMSRPILTCIHVSENYMEASDGFQIMRSYMPEGEIFPFPGSLIQADTIKEITKINPIQIARTNGWLHFRNADGTELSCRTLSDEFPAIEDRLQVSGDKVVFPKSMDDILDRVMVFTKKDHLMDEEMQILIKNNKLKVKGKNEYGWIEETTKVKYEGKKASFWITPYLLKNILNRSNTCELGEEKIKFRGQNWEYVAVLRGE